MSGIVELTGRRSLMLGKLRIELELSSSIMGRGC